MRHENDNFGNEDDEDDDVVAERSARRRRKLSLPDIRRDYEAKWIIWRK